LVMEACWWFQWKMKSSTTNVKT